MFHINKIHIEHLHLADEKKLDEILEAIKNLHDVQLDRIIKQVKAITKDIKSTPTK